MGMRIRLKAGFDISGFSPANQVILTAMKQYGMILADNGGYFYFQGAPDPRWDDNDLSNLDSIGSENFEVVQMTPEFPGWDSATAPTGNAPVINSFTASASSVASGSPVTFNYNVTGDSYDYIDMIGPVTAGGGSVTISPTATQTYTLYSMNQYGDNGSGVGYGESVSTPITVTVPGSVVAPPVFAPPAGLYANNQLLVTLSTPTSPYAAIYYTTDGSTPTYPISGTTQAYPATPTPPNNPGTVISITVSPTETVKAIAVVSGYSAASAMSSATYTLVGSAAAMPTFSVASGSYNSAQTVAIGTTTPSATIYYTTDGSNPASSSTAIKYQSAITVSTSETINAVAEASGEANSLMASAAYDIVPPQVAAPAFSLPAGAYVGTQMVTISDATPNATIYYTTGGATPSTASSVYRSAIAVSTSETLRAMATASSYANSEIASAAYSIATATPTFSPAAGNYAQPQTVTIGDATPNATIYYTANETTPTTGSSVYHSAITVSATQTLEAIATASDYLQSAVGSAAYTITPGAQAAPPTFNPAAGSYIGTQTVTIGDTSLGATIYYTLTPGTTGTTPTASSTAYTGPIAVSGTSVLEAIALGGGFTGSTVASAAYTIITPPSLVQQCYSNSAGSATMTCTLSGAKSGDALVIGTYSAPLTSVTSSTTAQPLNVISNFATAESIGDFNVYLLPNIAAGNITITATANGRNNANAIVVDEYTNVAASPLDGSAAGSCPGYCTTVSSPNFTTTAAADMLWAMCNADQSTLTAGTVPIAWTAILPQGNGGWDSGYVNFFVEDGVAGYAGTYYGECSNAYLSSIATIALKPPPALVTPAVTVTPTPSSITTAQALTVAVAVSGGSGSPTPTGSVTLTSGSYTSSPATLSGGGASFNVPAGSLPTGTDSLTAAYTPDASSSSTFSSASGSQSVTVTAAMTTPTITWNTPAAITYGAALSATQLDASASVAGSFSYSPALGAVLAAGLHTLTANFTPSNTALYNTAASTVQMSVNPATLTVTANNASMNVGAAVPALTASYNGFIPGDGASVLSGTPALSTTATSSSPAGNYPITVAVGTLRASNYQFSFVNGVLTVSAVVPPPVSLTNTSTVTGSASAGYTLAITVKNTGSAAVTALTLSAAKLGAAGGSPLPQTLATLAAGASTTFTVKFPGSVGADGASVPESYSGTVTGGSFSTSLRSVTLP
jgi:hypothetical protein